MLRISAELRAFEQNYFDMELIPKSAVLKFLRNNIRQQISESLEINNLTRLTISRKQNQQLYDIWHGTSLEDWNELVQIRSTCFPTIVESWTYSIDCIGFFFLNTMNMADLNSGHTLGILVLIFMILCSISYFTLNKEKPGHSLAFSNFMTASKSIFAPASLVFSLIILIVYIADKVPTPWEYVLPTHLFLTTCYLFHDSEFQTKPWVPILKEIEYNMNKQPSSILRMLPIDEGGDHYMTTENFQVVLGQTKRLDPKFTAYLVKDEIHTRRKAYSILNRALLLGLRNQPTSLSITNLAKLEQRGSAHLLIMHLFRENPNEVYNLSRIIKSRNRVKYTLTNEQYTGDRDSIILVHNWSLTQVKNTAELLLDAILAKNTMQEDALFPISLTSILRSFRIITEQNFFSHTSFSCQVIANLNNTITSGWILISPLHLLHAGSGAVNQTCFGAIILENCAVNMSKIWLKKSLQSGNHLLKIS